jgi:predicted phosphate transport protein (TIGR00153 family)
MTAAGSRREALPMLRWFYALMPREEKFFDLFARHSHIVLEGAEALRRMIDGGGAVQRNYELVMERESQADAVTREVFVAIRRSFITPFDRASIQGLITAMDNTIDQMQKTAKTVVLFDVDVFSPQMRAMADEIVTAAGLVHGAIALLRTANAEAARLSGVSEQLSQIEGRADELHDLGLKELFRNHGKSDPMAFIIGSEIYDHLEKVVDRFDDVGNEINGIVLEQV